MESLVSYSIVKYILNTAGIHVRKKKIIRRTLKRLICTKKLKESLQQNNENFVVQEDETGNGVRTSPEGRSNSSWWGVKTESDDADDASRCSFSSTSTPPLVSYYY